jgi:5-methylthioribose kinase
MSQGADNELPEHAAIADAVRAALAIPPARSLSVVEITRHTNVNYVYHVTGEGTSVFVKFATAKLKAFEFHGPRSRVGREAARAKQFGQICGHLLEIPRVVLLDEQQYLVGLESVGDGRDVLLDVLRRAGAGNGQHLR